MPLSKLTEDSALNFKTLSEDKKKKGTLCELYGPVASFSSPTRNGRHYSEQLWEKLFDSNLIQERFSNGGIFGELGHPADREEVDMEKVACVMPEPPMKDDDGNLVAYVDVLDTPCGRIAYQLAKYGYKFGISSRGSGDLVSGEDGNEEVDPETYQLNAFDLVEVPAVEVARLSFVESLDTKDKRKALTESLKETLNSASDKDRKLMEDSLRDLNIDIPQMDPISTDMPPIDMPMDAPVDSQISAELDANPQPTQTESIKEEEDLSDDDKREWIKNANNEDLLRQYWSFLNNNSYGKRDNDISMCKEEILKRMGSAHESLMQEDVSDKDEEFYLDKLDKMSGELDQLLMSIKEDGKDKDNKYYDLFKYLYDAINEHAFGSIPDDGTTITEAEEDGNKTFKSAEELRDYIASLPDSDGVEVGWNEDGYYVTESLKKPMDEELEDEDGWGDQIRDILSYPFDVVEELIYEVRNCRRGSYARFGDSAEDLANKLSDIAEMFNSAAQEIDANEDSINESTNESCEDKELGECNTGGFTTEQVEEFKEALRKVKQLEKDNLSLQEKLSVCNAKEVQLGEELQKYKTSTATLSATAKKAKALTESVKDYTSQLDEKDKLIESLKKDNSSMKGLNEKVQKLQEELDSKSAETKSLSETLGRYKSSLQSTRDLYLEALANSYGLDVNEVKSKLTESYKNKDIKRVCDSMLEEKRNLSKLPFRFNESVQISAKADRKRNAAAYFNDDDNTESLLNIINNM